MSSELQLSCTETQFQKCSQIVKRGVVENMINFPVQTVDICMPDVCQFWDATALFTKVCVNLEQNSQNRSKQAKILRSLCKRAQLKVYQPWRA